MLGFLPGLGYLGSVDATIAAPRRGTPRAASSGRFRRYRWPTDRHLPARVNRRLADHWADRGNGLRHQSHTAGAACTRGHRAVQAGAVERRRCRAADAPRRECDTHRNSLRAVSVMSAGTLHDDPGSRPLGTTGERSARQWCDGSRLASRGEPAGWKWRRCRNARGHAGWS